ncbi:MAG TPA: HAD family phosphatase [Solirubrobacteraceae bacterium]|nr:HAD family phosphatase [Solirubrobacteraceae bacterium]
MPAAVIFDLDGVLLDSESVWNQAREQLTRTHGGRWSAEATRAMMGMSSTEWSAYMHDKLGVELDPPAISERVVAEVQARYRERLPLLPGAREVVMNLAGAGWPLALASSANRPIIDLFLDLAELRTEFRTSVSSEEVARGKPAPDVYLEAAGRLGAESTACAAVEDSANGLRSAAAAGMTVIAVPNREFRPDEEALGLATAVLASVAELTPELLRALDPGSQQPA